MPWTPDLVKRLLHLVELERLDDGFDLLHGLFFAFSAAGGPRPARGRGALSAEGLNATDGRFSPRAQTGAAYHVGAGRQKKAHEAKEPCAWAIRPDQSSRSGLTRPPKLDRPQTPQILTVGEMRAADRAAIAAGTPGRTLMERAGEAVADAIAARCTPRPLAVLCGPGNNGGDGFVARMLAKAGWPVRLTLAGDRGALKGDARLAADDWAGGVHPLKTGALDEAELVVDALFGAGLSGPLTPDVRAVLEAAEARGPPIVAVDLPRACRRPRPRRSTMRPTRRSPSPSTARSRPMCWSPAAASAARWWSPTSALAQRRPPRLFENGPGPLAATASPGRSPKPQAQPRRLGVVSGKMFDTGAARLAARAGPQGRGRGARALPDRAPRSWRHPPRGGDVEAVRHARGRSGGGRAADADAGVFGPGAGGQKADGPEPHGAVAHRRRPGARRRRADGVPAVGPEALFAAGRPGTSADPSRGRVRAGVPRACSQGRPSDRRGA